MRDGEIRRVLLAKLAELHKGDSDTLIVEEMGLCAHTARVDIAVINGALAGFEIKSGADSLVRLANQAAVYSGVLDFVTLVATPKHLATALNTVPESWGLTRVAERHGAIELHDERPARQHGEPDPLLLARMLWRDELKEELRAREMWRGLSTKPLGVLWERAAEIPVEELRAVVRQRVKGRGNWRSTDLTSAGND